MENYYMSQIEKHIQRYPVIGKEEVIKQCGQALELYELRDLNKDESRDLLLSIEKAIAFHESPYDVRKVASAIQSSRSGIGGSAMTPYTCAFCGKQDIWGNTAVPRICSGCAKEMATNILLHKTNLLKDEE